MWKKNCSRFVEYLFTPLQQGHSLVSSHSFSSILTAAGGRRAAAKWQHHQNGFSHICEGHFTQQTNNCSKPSTMCFFSCTKDFHNNDTPSFVYSAQDSLVTQTTMLLRNLSCNNFKRKCSMLSFPHGKELLTSMWICAPGLQTASFHCCPEYLSLRRCRRRPRKQEQKSRNITLHTSRIASQSETIAAAMTEE
jgi:hypothetical protein